MFGVPTLNALFTEFIFPLSFVIGSILFCQTIANYISISQKSSSPSTESTVSDSLLEKFSSQLSNFSYHVDSKATENEMERENLALMFYKNVYGRQVASDDANNNCHAEGHWLEKQFGIKRNGNNGSDICGYELKKDSQKITFGDWSADEYIFKTGHVLPCFNKNVPKCFTKENFLRIFGSHEKNKARFSWSGSCVPKYNKFNRHGQAFIVDSDNNIYAIYSHLFDRNSGSKPSWVTHQDFFILAMWRSMRIRNYLKNKFGQRGFILCHKNKQNTYDKIYFGNNIDFEYWIQAFKRGDVFFDSGMYEGNNRNYSQWRASRDFWYDLVTHESAF